MMQPVEGGIRDVYPAYPTHVGTTNPQVTKNLHCNHGQTAQKFVDVWQNFHNQFGLVGRAQNCPWWGNCKWAAQNIHFLYS